MADEEHLIDVVIDPTRAKQGADVVDRELVGMERQAKVSSREMSRAIGDSMREAAAVARRHQQQIATDARAAANAGKLAARDEARASVAARREQAQAARQAAAAAKAAAAEQAAAQRALATEVARTTAEYRRQQESAEAAHRRAGGGGGAGVAALGRFGAAAAGAFSVREAAMLADSYTSASNRIRQLTKDTAEFTYVQSQLFAVAQKTGSEYALTVELYQKVGKAALAMGKSQGEAIKLTETITMAIKASGAEGASAAAALQQLGQALDGGVLRGEEFNSVNEQAPILLDMLGRSLGKTRGELRKMAEQGELTAEIVVNGLQKQAPAAAEAFSKRLPTITEQWTRFKNELSKTFGEFAANANVAEAFKVVMAAIADTMKSVAQAVGMAVGAVKALNDALGGVPVDTIKAVLSFGKYTIPVFGQLILVNDITKTPAAGTQQGGLYLAQERRAGRISEEEYQRRIKDPYGLQAAMAAGDSALAAADAAVRFRRGLQQQSSYAGRGSIADPAAQAEFLRNQEIEQTLRDTAKARDDLRILVRDGIFKAESIIRNTLPEGLGGVDRPDKKKGKTDPDKIYHWINAFEDLGSEIEGFASLLSGEALEAADHFQERFAAERTAEMLEHARAVEESARAWKAWGEEMDDLVGKAAQASADLAAFEKEIIESQEAPMRELESAMKDTLADGFDQALRSAINFENGFKAIVQNLLREIAVLAAKMLLLKAIQAGFGMPGSSGIGDFLGGLVTGNMNYGQRAGGGQFTVGGTGGPDSQGVFFRATPGEIVTVSNPGLASNNNTGGGATVPLSIHLAGDMNALVTKHLSSPQGEQIVIDIVAKHAGKLRGALAR